MPSWRLEISFTINFPLVENEIFSRKRKKVSDHLTQTVLTFFQEKRHLFSRFYFLGDDDLLEILGQSTNPAVIQNHLKKLFQGIHSVQFDDNDKHILAMVGD